MPWRHIQVAEIFLNSFLPSALRVNESLASRLGPFTLQGKKAWYTWDKRLFGPSTSPGVLDRNLLSVSGIEPRTVQSTAQCLSYFEVILFVFYDRKSFVKRFNELVTYAHLGREKTRS